MTGTYEERRALERAAMLLDNPHTRQPDRYATRTPQGYKFCALGAYAVTNDGFTVFKRTGTDAFGYPDGDWVTVNTVPDLIQCHADTEDPSPNNEQAATAALCIALSDGDRRFGRDVPGAFDNDPEGFTNRLKERIGWIV